MPVDILFESLAHQRPTKAIGVILSGTGGDGAQGIKHIKEVGGITIAQEPASAAFEGLPNSAIQTGCVDLVLRPFEIAAELAKTVRHPYFVVIDDDESSEPITADVAMDRILSCSATSTKPILRLTRQPWRNSARRKKNCSRPTRNF